MRALLVLPFLVALVARAEPVAPLVMTHMGVLLDGQDKPVDETALPMTFRVFDRNVPSNGEQKFWEGACAVDLQRGRYAVVLGGACGTGLTAVVFPPGADRYLEVSVRGLALLPRLALTPVPLAGWAAQAGSAAEATHAQDADHLQGHTAEELTAGLVRLQAAPGAAQTGDVVVSGTVIAGAFEGDGSRLTHLSATALEGEVPASALPSDLVRSSSGAINVNGTVTASAFSGNGAALTNLSGAAVDSIAWSKLTGVPAALADGDDVGLTKVTVGAGLTGEGTTASPIGLGAGAIANAQLASDAASFAKVSGGAATVSSGRVGIGTTAPAARLDVDGGLRLGNDTDACSAAKKGTLRYTGTALEFCDGTDWMTVTLTRGPSSGGVLTPGDTSKVVTRDGWQIKCPLWNGSTCNDWQIWPPTDWIQDSSFLVDKWYRVHGCESAAFACYLATGNPAVTGACAAPGLGGMQCMYVVTSGTYSNTASGYTRSSTVQGAPWITFSGCGGENPPQIRCAGW